MSDEHDGLPPELTDLDGLPLPPAVKRSLWKSVGRLIGIMADLGTATLEHPKALIEAKTDAVRATAEARRAVKLGIAAKIPDMIAGDEALAMRAVAYLGHEMIAEQANREHTLKHAVEDLRSDPPKEDANREIDDDWLHGFMREASAKSSPEMQLLFGKILAGEIRSPGAFSLKAVRTLGMMSHETAKHFQILCNVSVVLFGAVKVISYSDNAANNSLSVHGLGFDTLNNLNENDLIYSDFNIWHDLTSLSKARVPFEYAGETVWLEPTGTMELSRVHGVVFSKVGRELRQIVSMHSDPRYTSEIIKYFETRGCDLVKALTRREDGSLVGRRYRDLMGTS